MTTANQWLGKIKKRAKSVQETAKFGIGKLKETLEKKLEEAEEDLKKKREELDATEPAPQQQKIWRPSGENPDGEIVTLAKPPSSLPSLSTTPSLSSQTSPPIDDLPTVRHTKARRHHSKKNGILSTSTVSLDVEIDSGNEQTNSFIQQRNNGIDIRHCLNDIIDEIINREIIDKCLNELIDIISTVDELVEHISFITILEKEDSINYQSEDNISLEKEQSVSSKTESDQENIQMNLSTEKLTTMLSIDNTSIENLDPQCISTDIVHDEISTTLANTIESPIEHSDSNENHPTTSENIIETLPNELEDSFDEWKTLKTEISRPVEKPPEHSADLAALRDFISQIKDDDESDEEPFTIVETATIIDATVNDPPEQIDLPNNTFTSLPVDTKEEISNESLSDDDLTMDEPSTDEKNQNTSTIPTEPAIIEKKRFSIVNCHSIPRGTKIYHINCSSTYIYICTNDKKIFYAELNINDMHQPLKWKQHSDLAERLVVSISNRTVWRLFNTHLYSSMDPMKFPPIGSQWNEIKIGNGQSLLSMSVNDECGWFIKNDGTLWLIRTADENHELINVTCPFNLNRVFCYAEKVGVSTNDGEILIRIGCTDECPEGDGWVFIEHNFGPIHDFVLLTNDNIISIIDKKHHLWIHQWSPNKGFFEVLSDDKCLMVHQRFLLCVNSEILCFTDCEEHVHIFSDCLTGVQWTVMEKNTRLQRLFGAFSNEDSVWALTTEKMIRSSNGQTLEKPRQAQYLTHATFVPDTSSQGNILWTLDESCNIYVRANNEDNTKWEQLDQSQFEWNRRLVHIVCNLAGVWAVDDHGYVHFRHGHMSASDQADFSEVALLPPAWISIPGAPKRFRSFSQVYCGPADWMVYATDNKQTVYARTGINEENRIGTSWKAFEDCSALELAVSENTLWLLTSCGQIQCRENISILHPIGIQSTTLPGLFLSLTVSIDDSQVWALDSKRNLLKLNRFTALFEK